MKNWLDSLTQRLVFNGFLYVQRPVTSGVPQGLVLGPMLSDISGGIKYTPSKFADSTKVSLAVDTSEGKGAIQRDLDMLEKWADANLMKSDNAKCKVLQPGHSNPIQTYRLGRAVIESRPLERGFGMMVAEKLNVRHHQKRHDQQDDRGDSAPLLCSWETPPGVLPT